MLDLVSYTKLLSEESTENYLCYVQATIESGPGGNLVWRYGEWTEMDEGTKYIKNLACEITT